MTNRLYDEDPYLSQFQATVLSSLPRENGYKILLDRTAFYPEGGGQPGDWGTLESTEGTIEVTDTQEGKDGEIYHYTNASLASGSKVTGTILWPRRFSHMQNHAGEHILSGIIHNTYGYNNVGFHMNDREITIDFDGPLTWEQILGAEKKANEAIYQNLPVEITFPSPEELKVLPYRSKKELTGPIRIVTFPGYDCCACCGTHVHKTGEIGIIKVTGFCHYKTGVRMSMLCGQLALDDYNRKLAQAQLSSRLLSLPQEEIASGIEKLKARVDALTQSSIALKRELAQIKLEALPQGKQEILLLEKDSNGNELRELVNLFLEKVPSVLALSPREENSFSYVLGDKNGHAVLLARELNLSCNGKGGGKEPMVQGTLEASYENIKASWDKLQTSL